MNKVTELFPMKAEPTAQDITEQLIQALLDGSLALHAHLDRFPRSLDHIRWAAKEGDSGCCGAAVPVALLEKQVSKLKARIINKHNNGEK